MLVTTGFAGKSESTETEALNRLAFVGDGSVRAWGDNRFGQLGLDGIGDASAPTVVLGIVGATGIAAGGRRSLAETMLGAVVEWGAGNSTPRTITGGLGSPVLGGEAGTELLGYNLGFQKSWYGYDTQGNVRVLTNPDRSLTDTYTYDAFGNLIDRAGTTDNRYLFQGERFDPETGLYHLRAREYDPRLGRFQQQDDFDGFVGQPFSHNRYAYAEGDPVNLHDPTGRFATSIAGAMYLLYELDDYLNQLASIGPAERALSLDDYLVDPMKAAMGIRPTVVNRERQLTLQATAHGALLGSIEQEAGAQAFPGGKRGKGADGDTFFTFKTGAMYRQSPVERLVESAWSTTRNLWPQVNTGSRYSTDPSYGKNLRTENRWSDVIYHDAILQSALRASSGVGLEVQARFTRTLGGRNYVARSGSISTAAQIQLKLADGGLRQWMTPQQPGSGDLFHQQQVGRMSEYGQLQLIKDFSSVNWADAWAQAAAKFDYSAASAVAYNRTGGNGVLSLAAAFGMGLPLAGEFAQSGFTAATGRDFITDERVAGWQRGLAIADVGLTLLPFGGNAISAALRGTRGAVHATRSVGSVAGQLANRALKASERGLRTSIQGARGAGQWLGNAANRSFSAGRRVASGALERAGEVAQNIPLRSSGDGRLRLASPQAGAIFPKPVRAAERLPTHLTSHPNAHTIGRHGGAVTDEQLMRRARIGVAPDGSGGAHVPPLSTAFYSDELMLQADAFVRGGPLQAKIAANPGANVLTLRPADVGDVGASLGRGFKRIGSSSNLSASGPLMKLENIRSVRATLEKNGNGVWETITMFPEPL